MFDNILLGLNHVLSVWNIIAIFAGVMIGLVVGAMPGLSATMAIALLLPLTFAMPAETGISMMAALYLAAMYGGSIAAILLRTPGTPAAAATVMDGYPMAAAGRPGHALGVSLYASLIGGIVSGIALLTIAPMLGRIVLEFGPVEVFAVAILGITIIASLSQESTVRGLFSGALGLLLATVGMDMVTGTPRFTFGQLELYQGIPFTVALIGLFSVPQAIRLIEQGNAIGEGIRKINDSLILTGALMRRLLPNVLRSSGIGVITGLIPGSGGDTACWFAYNEAKRFSKQKDKFGTGVEDGIAAPEAANNAVVGGSLIPTIALGIPGSSSTAVMMGGLMVHGVMPGPNLMTEHADITYTLIWAVVFANIALFLTGIWFTRLCVHVTRVPNLVLGPIIIVLCVIGSFAINNSMFDVYLMLAFGFLGYVFDRLKIPTPPLVLGLILGPLMDNTLGQSLLIGYGSWTVFLESPLALFFFALAILSLIQGTFVSRWLVGLVTRSGRARRI